MYHTNIFRGFFVCCLLIIYNVGMGQLSNDDCIGATPINIALDFCEDIEIHWQQLLQIQILAVGHQMP